MRSLTSRQTKRFLVSALFVGLDRDGSGLQNPSSEQAICDGPTEPAMGGNATAPPLLEQKLRLALKYTSLSG
ncbi:MAG: hypothetical protein EOR57_25465 [Mesorhizobium sp.]|nr:MAG: hypothetical protein EOR57_25465 [Mesorhizobium sp.]